MKPIFLRDITFRAAALRFPPLMARLACAIMSLWYCCSLRLASDSCLECPSARTVGTCESDLTVVVDVPAAGRTGCICGDGCLFS